jgi:hypothetical protein
MDVAVISVISLFIIAPIISFSFILLIKKNKKDIEIMKLKKEMMDIELQKERIHLQLLEEENRKYDRIIDDRSK